LINKRNVSKTIVNTKIDNRISFFLVTSNATFLMVKITKSRIIPGNHSIPFLTSAAVIKITTSPVTPEKLVSEKSMYNAKNR